jgi:hypothetical protein
MIGGLFVNNDQFLLFDKKQPTRLYINRMTIYLQSKIIEAFNENNEVYYLFFYKDNFLTSQKATQLKVDSHIVKAFKNGIIFDNPHPLINTLYSSCSPLKCLSFDQLLKKLENHFTPQETALILTFFESFIPKKVLFKHIQNIFYQYRRNGQLLAGYKILRILIEFDPTDTWAKPLATSLAYNKYADLYNQFSNNLLKEDPISAEKLLYLQKEIDNQAYPQLESILTNDSRWIDLIALLIYKFSVTPSNDHYHALLRLLEEHLNSEEIAGILKDLSVSLPNNHQLYKDLLERFLKLNQAEEALSFLTEHCTELSAPQTDHLESILEKINLEASHVQIEKLNHILLPLFKSEPKKLDKILQKCVTLLLKNNDLKFIKEWLAPLKACQQTLPIIDNVDKIVALSDDPNQQLLLGEFYYQFNQFDKAIECFSWEMELNSTDPKPVQWLSKIYQTIGMEAEYKAYQQLYINMQK